MGIFMQLFPLAMFGPLYIFFFLYFAEPAYELAFKFGLEFRNCKIYSKNYGEVVFLLFCFLFGFGFGFLFVCFGLGFLFVLFCFVFFPSSFFFSAK